MLDTRTRASKLNRSPLARVASNRNHTRLGQQVLLTHLEEGQNATVLQLPAAPKTEKEADEQKRAEYVG
jgi:hypothetical protein